MLSLFPQILFLAPLGIALLRVAVGIAFLYMGYAYWSGREALSREKVPVLTRAPAWLWMFGGVVCVAIGAFLIVGLYTQAAALFGSLAAFKCIFWSRRYAHLFPFSLSTNLLLLVICLALLVSGAGAFAFDLPL